MTDVSEVGSLPDGLVHEGGLALLAEGELPEGLWDGEVAEGAADEGQLPGGHADAVLLGADSGVNRLCLGGN